MSVDPKFFQDSTPEWAEQKRLHDAAMEDIRRVTGGNFPAERDDQSEYHRGHAEGYEVGLAQAKLPQIRIEALRAAATLVAAEHYPTVHPTSAESQQATIAIAKQFAEWLETGE